MFTNKITLKCLSGDPWAYCLTIIKKQFKSITGLAVLMLFLLGSNNLQAQIIMDNDLTDWYMALDGLPVVVDPNTEILTGVFIRDANSQNDNSFTTGSQDPDPASDWGWSFGSTNDKGDISNAGVIIERILDPVDGSYSNTLYFFGDRTAINGDAQIGFWFFTGGVAPADGSGTNKPFTGEKLRGDILVLSNFTNGGGLVQLALYEYRPDGDGNKGFFQLIEVTTDNAFVNTQPITITDNGVFAYSVGSDEWTYQTKNVGGDNNPPNFYPIGSFFQGRISLDEIIDKGGNPCFSSFLLETRQSPGGGGEDASLTAALNDFVAAPFSTIPDLPVTTPITLCVDDVITPDPKSLTADGTDLTWYVKTSTDPDPLVLEFFGTEDQPNKPVRAVVEVSGLAVDGWLIEIDVRGARIPVNN